MRRMLFGALAVGAALVAALTGMGSGPARAAGKPVAAVPAHVVVVGISGLRWTDISPATTPALWNVAGLGSVGSLVDFAVGPDTCPADAWLTLNGGDRAQVPHGGTGGCPALPAVSGGSGRVGVAGPARVAAMPSLVSYERGLKYGPRWGLLASAAGPGGCATAVGPGAALALAGPGGVVGSYLPAVSAVSVAVLARCPLTVADLGSLPAAGGGRVAAVRRADAQVAGLAAELPAGTVLLVAGLGSGGLPAHLQAVMISGPGYRAGLLGASSTRQGGMVVLTDLTATVLGWRGQGRPGGLPGAPVTAAARGPLSSVVGGLIGQDTAAQVWAGTHAVFFWAYALADLAVFAGIGLIFRGAGPGARARRAACWRVAGTIAGAVPAGSFLANVVPWWLLGHPAIWQYGLTVAGTALVAGIALAGPWRRDPFGPPGVVALATVLIIGLDVMTGSRLQLGAPFGLSVLEGGRFYGIGGEAVGLYAVCALIAIAWVGNTLLQARSRGRAAAAAAAVAAFAVIACGWPQFGAKAGGTIALVPCALLLLLALAGIKITARRAAVVLGTGVALFAVFALINYLIPATGTSDIGAFAGNLIHGHAGSLLTRKLTSMLGSIGLSPAVLPIIILVGLILLKPSWFAVRALPRGYAAEPLLAMTLAMMWLVCVLGWFADDSGIAVPGAALPLALPLGIALVAGIPLTAEAAASRGPVTGSSVSGRTV